MTSSRLSTSDNRPADTVHVRLGRRKHRPSPMDTNTPLLTEHKISILHNELNFRASSIYISVSSLIHIYPESSNAEHCQLMDVRTVHPVYPELTRAL